jgi:FkbM family methyltransferase
MIQRVKDLVHGSLLRSQIGKKLIKRRYLQQKLVSMRVGSYLLEVPERHFLAKEGRFQKHRDLCIGITAKYLGLKYPNSQAIDIGANIGDTAAIIATYSDLKLVLVEPSEYYFNILQRNAERLGREYEVIQAFISSGEVLNGSLSTRGGTASFEQSENKADVIYSKRLNEFVNINTRLIKTDTDGFDFRILNEGIDCIAAVKPAILLENDIRSVHALDESTNLYGKLCGAGYRYFVLWDDTGLHITSTSNISQVLHLNLFLLNSHNQAKETGRLPPIWNYEVLCLHETDKDIYEEVTSSYSI